MNLIVNVKIIFFCTILGVGFGSQESFAQDGAVKFDEQAFYTITADVSGKKMALTFVPAEGEKCKTCSGSKARVVLSPLKKGDASQLWNLSLTKIEPKNSFLIYAKISDSEYEPTGILRVYKINGEFSDVENHNFHDEYNRLTVWLHNSETSGYWVVTAAGKDKFRLASLLGHKSSLRKPDDSPSYGWREERTLEAMNIGGKFVLRHSPPNPKSTGQIWSITKAGFLDYKRK